MLNDTHNWLGMRHVHAFFHLECAKSVTQQTARLWIAQG